MTEILMENEQNKTEITEEITDAIKLAIEETLKYENCDFEAELSVTIVDNEEIRKINNEHRGIDKHTDVLSFPMLEFDEDGNAEECEFDFEDDMVILGDIVISAEKAAEQANEFGHSFKREMAFLTVHSMLHLLGYDHVDNPEGEAEMIKKQKEILEKMGISR